MQWIESWAPALSCINARSLPRQQLEPPENRQKADGITVLDDSRHPERLFARGPWTLWDEMESVGTVPQQAGTRKCSLRAKGDVGDWWLTSVMGGRPFRQIMGFNADEPGRRFGDQAASKIPGRTGVYPLIS
ncbi:hypothetical protein [Streptomyces mirabilis]|uniref:hypothetical protein n=1 Tax=Streptomyces mirabilis TaxID=68239 RepID=UPI0037194797